MNRQEEGDAISGSGFVGKGQEAGALDSGNHWGWVSAGEEEAWSLPRPPPPVSASAPSFWAPPTPSPWAPRPGLGRRDPGALAAHDTYSFRIWRAVASAC